MSWIDYAILGIVGVSALIGLSRGLLREVISLSAWVMAYWLSTRLAEPIADVFRTSLESDTLRLASAYAGVFIGVLILGAVINHLVSRFVDATGFSGTDRTLGVAFGIARGVAILTIFVLLAGMTTLPRDDWWRQSVFLERIEPLAVWVRDRLPASLAGSIHFSEMSPKLRS